MSLRERIESEITGNADQQLHRKELLQIIANAFAKGGHEAVAAELAARMEAIERQFAGELDKLEATL